MLCPADGRRPHAFNSSESAQSASSSAAARLPVSPAQPEPRTAPVVQQGGSMQSPRRTPRSLVQGGACSLDGVGLASLGTPPRTAGYSRPLTAAMTPGCGMPNRCAHICSLHKARRPTRCASLRSLDSGRR